MNVALDFTNMFKSDCNNNEGIDGKSMCEPDTLTRSSPENQKEISSHWVCEQLCLCNVCMNQDELEQSKMSKQFGTVLTEVRNNQ